MKYSLSEIMRVIRKIFLKYDIDEDGFLDRQEVTLLINSAC